MLRLNRIVGLLIMAALIMVTSFPAGTARATSSWANTGSLPVAYRDQTLTVLPPASGVSFTKVLTVGGYVSNPASYSVLYDPTGNGGAGTWAWTSNSMLSTRYRHTATLVTMGDGSQRVLVTGGYDLSGAKQSAELFGVSTLSWQASTLTMQTKHAAHAAALLSDGRVLIIAGDGISNGASEIYDPTSGSNGTFSSVAALPQKRANHTATTLTDGTVLVAGGTLGTNNTYTYVYSPTADTWTRVGDLSSVHNLGVAVRLNNGKVLLVGGNNSSNVPTAVSELYDPSTQSWTTTGSMNTARKDLSLTVLPDGKVLAAGGRTDHSSTEIYDPSTGSWTTDVSMNTARYSFGAALITMSDGTQRVLVAGGTNSGGLTATSERYTP